MIRQNYQLPFTNYQQSPNSKEKPMEPILQVKDLVTRFYSVDGVVHAINGVTFDLYEGLFQKPQRGCADAPLS